MKMKVRVLMNDTKILEKVKDWLKSNLEGGDIDQIDIEEDNKALLDAIEDWKGVKARK